MSTSPSIKTQDTPTDVVAKPDLLRVDCYDRKYTVVQESDGGLYALRYGEHWRNCVGDGLILGLAQDLRDARDALDPLKKEVEQLRAARAVDLRFVSISDQVTRVALSQLWDMLGVNNQTEAVHALRDRAK